MQKISGTWLHIASQVPYKVVGVARDVLDPQKLKVVYESTQESLLRESNQLLPVGTIWIRDLHDFEMKFSQLK